MLANIPGNAENAAQSGLAGKLHVGQYLGLVNAWSRLANVDWCAQSRLANVGWLAHSRLARILYSMLANVDDLANSRLDNPQ